MTSLPRPELKGSLSLEEALTIRRTVRSFTPKALTLSQLSQLLWAAYGISDAQQGKKTAPSAGALYPLDIYIVVGEEGVEGLGSGVYHYLPTRHVLEIIASGDRRKEVAHASLWQMWMAEAPVMVTITAEYKRTTVKYRERGVRYVHMEVGHAGENLFLQCVALGLRAGIVGAFNDDEVADALGVPPHHEPLLIIPVGHPR
ncbi:MAG: SagB/ThcOx family dehydrogenase [Deltaproteobacteria bacterium]|nr:SagB/ThcOx family dehydrogenase [Deltaproteobacteria bacterium]